MKPIDNIRKGIDSDLNKYHGSNLCMIRSDDDIKSVAGVGLVAIVTPLNKLKPNDVDLTSDVESQNLPQNNFPVVIVNRTSRWFERGMSAKYNVLVLNTESDKKGIGIGLLVPSTAVRDVELLRGVDSLDSIDNNGVPLQSMSREYIPGGE